MTSAHPRDDVRIFLKECRGLARSGHDVTLVVADGRGDEVRDGVSIVDAGVSRGRLKRMLVTTRRVFRKAIALDADVYHLHDPELLPAGLALKRSGKRVVFDAHEDVPQQILAKSYLHPAVRRVLSWALARFERYACERFDGVVTATPHIREKFRGINARSVDINNFPILGELEVAISWESKEREVCYIGNIAEIRGIKQIVRAMESVSPAIRLNLVGGFAEPQVEAEVRAYPGWSKVNFHGVQDRRGVRDVLSRSVAGMVTLYPVVNYLDALPVKMFEYMSAGIPVIASNFPLWRQILEKTECGICVDPLDADAIARAVVYIVADPDRARRMGQNGRRLIEDKFNWANEEIKLIEFYRQLLAD